MVIQFEHCYDRLNIVLILAPGHEFLYDKCVQF